MIIETFDQARKAAAAHPGSRLKINDMALWGFETDDQFFIPSTFMPEECEANYIINKSDGKVFRGVAGNLSIFEAFGRNGLTVIGNPGEALEYDWVQDFLNSTQ